MSTMLISRGLKANVPALADGQQYLCTDTNEIFVGNGGVNINTSSTQTMIKYDDLVSLRNNSKLKPGHQYIITNYATMYVTGAHGIHQYCAGERLIVTATNTNTISPQCQSLDRPSHIIWYDIDDNLDSFGNSRPGYIKRRYDIQNYIDTAWDFWGYSVDVSRIYTDGLTTYTEGMMVSADDFYILGNDIVRSNSTGVPTSETMDSFFSCVLSYDYETDYILAEDLAVEGHYTNIHYGPRDYQYFRSTYGSKNLSLGSPGTVTVAYRPEPNVTTPPTICFNGECENIVVGHNCANIIFGKNVKNVTIGSSCKNITIGDNCSNIHIGNEVTVLFIARDCSNITVGDGCYKSIMSQRCKHVTLGSNCVDNTFGEDCQNVDIGHDVSRAIIGKSVKNISSIHDALTGKNLASFTDFKNNTTPIIIEKNANGDAVYRKLDASNVQVYTTIP